MWFQNGGYWLLSSVESLKLTKFDIESCFLLLNEAGLRSLGETSCKEIFKLQARLGVRLSCRNTC